jgi:hypothetical protein
VKRLLLFALPLFALPLIVGCGGEALRVPEPAEVAVTWSGSFDDVTCNPGTLSMKLEQTSKDHYDGTLRYETRATGELEMVTYDVRGSTEDGVLKVDQLGVVETNAPAVPWCIGHYAFAIGEGDDGPSLFGAYDAHEDACHCGGITTMTSGEAP